jgi:hypothetical protein
MNLVTAEDQLSRSNLDRIADRSEHDRKIVQVNSIDNAVIKLKTGMNADRKYNWDLAQVVESHEKQ